MALPCHQETETDFDTDVQATPQITDVFERISKQIGFLARARGAFEAQCGQHEAALDSCLAAWHAYS